MNLSGSFNIQVLKIHFPLRPSPPNRVSRLYSPLQDAPVQTQVRQALARPRMAHALRPSATSSQRVIGDLRSTKWSTRREERYRILSSHRTGISSPAETLNPQADDSLGEEEKGKDRDKCCGLGEIQVVDLIHEDVQDQDKSFGKVSLALQSGYQCFKAYSNMLRESLDIGL